MTFIVHSETNK